MVTHDSATGAARLDTPTDARELLRSRYEAYCNQQAAALPALLPREGVRALYRSARARVTGEISDPLALLLEECRRVLPVPPFEVWAEDYARNRRPYLEEMEQGAGPAKSAPVTVDLRRLQHAGRSWVAGLSVFHEPPSWRGFITFHPEVEAEVAASADASTATIPRHRTADVFRADRSEDVRERFQSFTETTLQAFLRSSIS